MYDRSHKEIKTGSDNACNYSSAKTKLHNAHLLMLEITIGSLDYSVKAAVLLCVVDLAEGSVQDYHTEPLETAEPLIDDEAFKIEKPKQPQVLA